MRPSTEGVNIIILPGTVNVITIIFIAVPTLTITIILITFPATLSITFLIILYTLIDKNRNVTRTGS